MIRVVLEMLALFATPFVLYALYVGLRTRDPRAMAEIEAGPARYLVVAGLALVVAAMLYAGLFGERHVGAYRPAEMRDGVLVPGRVD